MVNKINEVISKYMPEFKRVSTYIYENPELGGEEYKAVDCLTELLKRENFEIRYPCKDMPTAFIAKSGNYDGPNFCFLAEYDALSGYGPNSEAGHACGHNWIGATMAATGIVLSKIQDELKCNIYVYGTPAEETFGGKVDMVKAGLFDNMDICMQAHLDCDNCMEPNMMAMNSLEFTFHGKASHAGSYPENGVNALDAVMATFYGINQMRQHFRSDSRIHGIITKGGDAPNTVPELAKCKISFRSKTKGYLEEMRRRVINIAKGAELMTGATMEYEFFENPLDNLLNISSFVELGQSIFKAMGYKDFIPNIEYPGAGSTDLGNVSQICPTLYFEVDLGTEEQLCIHDQMALKLVDGPQAHEKIADVAKGFAEITIKLAQDKELLEKIKKEHNKIKNIK